MIIWLFLLLFFYVFKPEFLILNLFDQPEIPLGTALSWVILATYAFILYWLVNSQNHSKAVKRAKQILLANFILSAFWGVISFYLSGNWMFSFRNSTLNFKIWLAITALVIVLPLLVYSILGIKRFLSRFIHA